MTACGRLRGSLGALIVVAALSSLTGCDTPVQDPWLGEAQRDLYAQDQYQRAPAVADELRHRLKYRVAER